MATNTSTLPERLKLLRAERGLSQNALADLLGLSRGIIGNYEIGARAPDYETLRQFAHFYDVSLDYLLGETDIRQRLLSEPQAQRYEKLLNEVDILPERLQTQLEESLIYADLIKKFHNLSNESIQELEKYAELLTLRDHMAQMDSLA